MIFQSTHPVRGATGNSGGSLYEAVFQSTHPVRGATACRYPLADLIAFQSTHPVRGATDLDDTLALRARNFNPRTP